MSAMWLRVFAHMGDLYLIAPAFAGVGATLWRRGRRRDAASWTVMFCLAAAIIWLLKSQIDPFSVDIGWRLIRAPNLPSGHVGMSMIFYGQAAILLWQGGDARRKLAGAAIGVLLAVIASAVYLIGWHSLLDIAASVVIGGLLLAALSLWRARAGVDARSLEAA